jgi:histidinol-phosphate aminotransferase
LKPYSSARDEFVGDAEIFLDANENPFPTLYNRYPDPLQRELKAALGNLKNMNPSQLFLGNGSDEPIDLLIRAFCEPYSDSILITPPTYGMYKVCADINAVKVQEAVLTKTFQLDLEKILATIDHTTKIIFLCSPNNPSGNLLKTEDIKKIITTFNGIVVLDEAYIDFSSFSGFTQLLNQYPNLVILQTLSKAWGLAGLRLGMCFAASEIITILNKIKYPYNINVSTQTLVLTKLMNEDEIRKNVSLIVNERELLRNRLSEFSWVKEIFPSDANFLLVRVTDAKSIYHEMMKRGIILRDRSNVILCENSLRITIGTPEENSILIENLKSVTL